MSTQILDHAPIFDPKHAIKDVFVKLRFRKNTPLHFGDALSAWKTALADVNNENLCGLYAYRSENSYDVIGHFKKTPVFPSTVADDVEHTTLDVDEIDAISKKQMYALNDKGLPIHVYIPSEYGINFYFKQRSVKNHENIHILSVYNPAEYVAALDFSFSNAVFVFNQEPINKETFYIMDQWSKDVCVGINEEAELAYKASEEFAELKVFRDYKPNDIVLIKHSGSVRRGCVLSCSEHFCEVLCVDYGVKISCSLSQLRIAPSTVAFTRFLAIPCVLYGINKTIPQKGRKFLDELIHSLGRDSAKLNVREKDQNAFVRVEIMFEQTHEKQWMSMADYLNRSGCLDHKPDNVAEPTRKYNRNEMLKLLLNAHEVKLADDVESIRRTFVNPADFIVENECTKKLGIVI
ncbi:hypothetical protein M3Y95_00222300 [Aphelenchoides besseyi]|nr:hypothetical protein M3Y95_00222300 [Aphelenchoides besseyi]